MSRTVNFKQFCIFSISAIMLWQHVMSGCQLRATHVLLPCHCADLKKAFRARMRSWSETRLLHAVTVLRKQVPSQWSAAFTYHPVFVTFLREFATAPLSIWMQPERCCFSLMIRFPAKVIFCMAPQSHNYNSSVVNQSPCISH